MLNAGMAPGLKYKIMRKIGLGPRIEANGWLNNPKAIQLRHQFKKNNFGLIEESLSSINGKNEELYSLLISALRQFSGNPRFIDEYVKKYPNSVHANIISGSNKIHWAWEARTGNYAEEVADKQWKHFFDRLEQAQNLLNRAVYIDSSNAEAYSYLIKTAMGMGAAQSELFTLFSVLKMKSPNHLIGHSHMLYALTEKWGGSDEDMFSFARNTFTQATPGSSLGALIAQAHIEKWSDIEDEDDELACTYISSSDVKEELLQAFNQSINHKNYQYNVLTPMFAGIFAMAFYLSGNYKMARINCAKLTKGLSEYPWYYLNETEKDTLNAGYVLDRVIKKIRNG